MDYLHTLIVEDYIVAVAFLTSFTQKVWITLESSLRCSFQGVIINFSLETDNKSKDIVEGSIC